MDERLKYSDWLCSASFFENYFTNALDNLLTK